MSHGTMGHEFQGSFSIFHEGRKGLGFSLEASSYTGKLGNMHQYSDLTASACRKHMRTALVVRDPEFWRKAYSVSSKCRIDPIDTISAGIERDYNMRKDICLCSHDVTHKIYKETSVFFGSVFCHKHHNSELLHPEDISTFICAPSPSH